MLFCCHVVISHVFSLNRPTGEDGKVFSVLFTVGISNIINLGKGQWLRNSHNSLFFLLHLLQKYMYFKQFSFDIFKFQKCYYYAC